MLLGNIAEVPLARFIAADGGLASFIEAGSSGFCSMLPMKPYSRPADSEPNPRSPKEKFRNWLVSTKPTVKKNKKVIEPRLEERE